jgi:membrane protein YqaA with SNARE-associated domain
MILKILTVAAMATFEIYVAIPTGFSFGLGPWTILIATISGGLTGIFIAAFLGQKIEDYFNKRRKTPKKQDAKTGLIYKIWEKYGIIGLGIFGTMTLGAPISIAVGVGLNVSLKKLVPLCCFAVVLRCFILTFFGNYIAQFL